MENTITFLHPELEDICSFPLNFFEFNSSPGHDSLCDDDDDDSEEEEEEEAYIEIDLELTPTDTNVEGEGKLTDDKELEYQFPISFSWSSTRTAPPFQRLYSSTTTSTPTSTCSAATSFVCPIHTPVCPQAASKGDSSETGNKQNGDHPQLVNGRDNCKLMQSRKGTRVVTTAMNGGVMKLLIKFRSNMKHFRSILASLTTKPEQSISTGGNSEDTRSKAMSVWNYQRLIKPFERWSLQRKRQVSTNTNTNTNESRRNGTEINLDTIRGVVLEAITSINFGRLKGKIRRRKSCPSSIKPSPPTDQNKIYTRDNSSVQAAIAHCKRSFDQTPSLHS